MTLRWNAWSDHLPLWIAYGAVLSTGIYEPGELAVMAFPLAAGALIEALRWDLSRHQRWLEILALIFFLGDLSRGQGLFAVAIHTLFLLAGVRLALPRRLAHRRQLLLMGFLLFLTTALGPTDLLFLVWILAWTWAAALALLLQSWEPSAALHRGLPPRAPHARIPLWIGAALLFGAGFFLALPRLSLGLRPALLAGAARTLGQAGLSDQLELLGSGPIEPNPDVAVRIAPLDNPNPSTDPQWTQGLELLRGVTLESVQGLRWEASYLTHSPPFDVPADGANLGQADFFFTPSPHGILALPSGTARLDPPGLPLVRGAGASTRWRFPRLRMGPVTVSWNRGFTGPREPQISTRRMALLTQMGPEHESARRASFRHAPDLLSTPQLAQTLERALHGFSYSLENPSGRAANPLEDFLERTQAGHCEYFASAMALMLRARGVPARVVNGYRLGPWIPEGNYFRVSQNEAHSWVEYWHEGRWHTSDPTPSGTGTVVAGTSQLGTIQRWLDTLRYRWDRHVVRFSDQDQQSGLSWIQEQLQGWEWRWKAPPRWAIWMLGSVAIAWALWRTRGLWRPTPEGPGRIRALRPLLWRTRNIAPPKPGDTARAWLLGLGRLRPERREALIQLADAVDAEAYGSRPASAPALAKAEAEAWRGWKPPTSPRTSRRPSSIPWAGGR